MEKSRNNLQLRLGFNRFNSFHFGPDYGINENNILGIPNGNLAAFPESSGIARFTFSSGISQTARRYQRMRPGSQTLTR